MDVVAAEDTAHLDQGRCCDEFPQANQISSDRGTTVSIRGRPREWTWSATAGRSANTAIRPSPRTMPPIAAGANRYSMPEIGEYQLAKEYPWPRMPRDQRDAIGTIRRRNAVRLPQETPAVWPDCPGQEGSSAGTHVARPSSQHDTIGSVATRL